MSYVPNTLLTSFPPPLPASSSMLYKSYYHWKASSNHFPRIKPSWHTQAQRALSVSNTWSLNPASTLCMHFLHLFVTGNISSALTENLSLKGTLIIDLSLPLFTSSQSKVRKNKVSFLLSSSFFSSIKIGYSLFQGEGALPGQESEFDSFWTSVSGLPLGSMQNGVHFSLAFIY